MSKMNEIIIVLSILAFVLGINSYVSSDIENLGAFQRDETNKFYKGFISTLSNEPEATNFLSKIWKVAERFSKNLSENLEREIDEVQREAILKASELQVDVKQCETPNWKVCQNSSETNEVFFEDFGQYLIQGYLGDFPYLGFESLINSRRMSKLFEKVMARIDLSAVLRLDCFKQFGADRYEDCDKKISKKSRDFYEIVYRELVPLVVDNIRNNKYRGNATYIVSRMSLVVGREKAIPIYEKTCLHSAKEFVQCLNQIAVE